MSDHWIPITYNDDTGEKLQKAVAACHSVHVYTLKTLNDYFIDHAENYHLKGLRRELAIYLRDHQKNLAAQHYSLTKAAEQTFPYFTENKKINNKGKFIAVKPIPADRYKQIQIETRKVWFKYLALNSLITTTYGTIYLDDKEWAKIVADQAAEKGVGFDTVPYLWHSVVLHVGVGDDKIKFNLHEPKSKFGKRSIEEMKQYAR